MLRFLSLILVLLIVDLVFFGPFGLKIYDVPVRKVLMGTLIVCSIVPTLTQRPVVTWQITLIVGMVLFLLVWGAIVPMANGVNLLMTAAEVQPIVGFLLVLPFYHLFAAYGPEFYLKVIRYCVFVMAIIVIVVWAASNVFGRVGIGLAMREFYSSLSDTEAGIYIGPMGDGTFRVMLINFIMFPLMLCYYNWERPRLGWSAFYALAIFATGTRAFLVVWALIVGVALLRKRPLLALPAVLVVVAVMTAYSADLQHLRVFEFSSELNSTSARYVQYFSLMALFWSHPIFGAGLGANAIVIRSYDAPYSYELTYVALLAKLGLLGSGIVLTAVCTWTARLMRSSPNWPSIATLIIAVFMMTSTNPYLINLVGMSIAAVVVALGAQPHVTVTSARTLLGAGQPTRVPV